MHLLRASRRLLAVAPALVLLSGAGPGPDTRYQRANGGFGRVEGRPDREEVVRGGLAYGPSGEAYAHGLRPYEQAPQAVVPVAPAPRRDYFPGMRPGQYTSRAAGHDHCTPSRGYLAGRR